MQKASPQPCPWAREQTAEQTTTVAGTEAAGQKPSFSKAPGDPPNGPSEWVMLLLETRLRLAAGISSKWHAAWQLTWSVKEVVKNE